MGQLELLWAAAALMLLGAIVSLCVKCQLSATKRKKQQSERRSQFESQHGFEVIRSHSTTTRRLEQIKEPENLSIARNITKELGASRHAGYGSRTESRYQNFLTGNLSGCAWGWQLGFMQLCGVLMANPLCLQRTACEGTLPMWSPLLWITTTMPGSSCHPTRKRRIPIPIRTSSLESLTAATWSQMTLQTTRTARRYTYGNSSKRKLCRQKAWMMSQTTSTQPLCQTLSLCQSEVFCIKSEEVLYRAVRVYTGRGKSPISQ
nr:linker for activation of T-cells family member 2 isoform X1 [Columba livia]XP_021144063.1 linker for activation of T-cells family member 2 isoform X1 [Columba livia]XP_021144064.1 linker for activation of T-cells family member 2 isoform X1 [Columba livia]